MYLRRHEVAFCVKQEVRRLCSVVMVFILFSQEVTIQMNLLELVLKLQQKETQSGTLP